MAIQVFLCSSSFQLIRLIALETGSFKGLNQDFLCVTPTPIPGTPVASSGCNAVPRGLAEKHDIVWGGRDLKDHPVPTPLP